MWAIPYGQILGVAGLVVTDDVLVHAADGYGIDLGAPDEADVLLAGGLELAVSENVSVEAQYLHGLAMDVVNAEDQVQRWRQLSLLYHFRIATRLVVVRTC